MNSDSAAPPRRILLTGGCGYLGAQILRDVVTDAGLGGPAVRVLDNMQRGHHEALMDLPDGANVEFVEGDILDPAAVRLALRGVDAVIHLAALVTTPMSFDNPIWVEQVNHWGTSQLVEACLAAGVQRLIYASSASVYGPGGPFTEEDEPKPLGPYAQSKRQGELSVLGAISRGLKPTVLRLGTVYGQGYVTRYDAVVNRFAFLAGVHRALSVYGEGTQVRPFIHLKDASAAVLFCLGQQGTEGVALNATPENISVMELVDAVRQSRPMVRVRHTDQDVLTHQSFVVDGSALEGLGWRALHTYRDGLAELLAHFKGLHTANRTSLDDIV